MMSRLLPYWQRVRDGFLGLTDREQKLLGVLAIVLTVFFAFLMISSQMRKTREWKEGALDRRDAISQLISRRGEYARAMEETRELNAKMDRNAMSIPSFVEARCRQLNITQPTNFRDSRQPVGGNPSVTALATEVVFPEMTLAQLSDFSAEVQKSGELIYIQRVEIKEKRQGEGFEVSMQLTTYQNNKDGDEDL